jgi:hypothetical protein
MRANGEVLRVPAMIAAMRCIHTDRLVAVQRTHLAKVEGEGIIKIGRRVLRFNPSCHWLDHGDFGAAFP